MDTNKMNEIPSFKQERAETIKDFGEQWTDFTRNEGHYATKEIFQDICGELLNVSELQNKNVADIGSGTGRIVNMLLDAGVAHVTAIEPSSAFEVLKANTQGRLNSITYINDSGDNIPQDNFDYVFSIGVIHHIKDPLNTLKAMYNSLKPATLTETGGKCLIWIYGAEGNSLYLAIANPLRKITTKLPHCILKAISAVLVVPLSMYIFACRYVKLPMHTYMTSVLSHWNLYTRLITIYDQLNPQTAEYYSQQKVYALFEEAGFQNIRMFHRHGYSWTLIGERTI